MNVLTIGVTSLALASVALLGYLVGLHERRKKAAELRELSRQLDETQTLISQIESVSDRLRRSMATHHTNVTRCNKEIQVLSQSHATNGDYTHHVHWQEMLAPTQRLSDEIAHAYDELRQHTSQLRSLRSHPARTR